MTKKKSKTTADSMTPTDVADMADIKKQYSKDCGLFGEDPDMTVAECKGCKVEDHVMWVLCQKSHALKKGEAPEAPQEAPEPPAAPEVVEKVEDAPEAVQAVEEIPEGVTPPVDEIPENQWRNRTTGEIIFFPENVAVNVDNWERIEGALEEAEVDQTDGGDQMSDQEMRLNQNNAISGSGGTPAEDDPGTAVAAAEDAPSSESHPTDGVASADDKTEAVSEIPDAGTGDRGEDAPDEAASPPRPKKLKPKKPRPAGKETLRGMVADIIYALGDGLHTAQEVTKRTMEAYGDKIASRASLEKTVGYGIGFGKAFGILIPEGRITFRLKVGISREG